MTLLYSVVRNSFFVAVGNHAATNRIVYNSPANRRVVLDYAQIIIDESIATAYGAAYIHTFLNGGAVFIDRLVSQNAIAQRLHTIGSFALNTGDIFTVQSANSTANVLTFTGFATFREYY